MDSPILPCSAQTFVALQGRLRLEEGGLYSVFFPSGFLPPATTTSAPRPPQIVFLPLPISFPRVAASSSRASPQLTTLLIPHSGTEARVQALNLNYGRAFFFIKKCNFIIFKSVGSTAN